MTQEYRQPIYAPPSGAADILLIRHGESQAARAGQSFAMKDGQGDPPLRPEGEAQARAIADRLGRLPIAAIYVTPLCRTHQTAAPLAQALGQAPVEERDLREVHLGDWDGGLYRIKAANRDPVYERARAAQDWGLIPGAESTAAVMARVRAGLLRIAAAHPDRLVAVFAHGGTIGAALALAADARPFAFLGAANGSISRLVVRGEEFTVRGFNDVAHLD